MKNRGKKYQVKTQLIIKQINNLLNKQTDVDLFIIGNK